jgi:hypothetical protein
MKIYHLICGIFLGGVVGYSGSAIAQTVPSELRQQMPYAEAREIILNAGWQAIYIPPLQRGEMSGLEQRMVEEFGYGEVSECQGTGMGLCRFEFAAADGRSLIVLTGSNEAEPSLFRWWVD